MCDMAIVAVKTNNNTDKEGVTLLIIEEGFNKGILLKTWYESSGYLPVFR
jgi:hypothetical protein